MYNKNNERAVIDGIEHTPIAPDPNAECRDPRALDALGPRWMWVGCQPLDSLEHIGGDTSVKARQLLLSRSFVPDDEGHEPTAPGVGVLQLQKRCDLRVLHARAPELLRGGLSDPPQTRVRRDDGEVRFV